ncbi:MAG TPA: hypothetical protein VGM32_18280 [Rhodopila sp.]
MEIIARWGEIVESGEPVIGSGDCRFIGAIAAALAVPHMQEEVAACFAEQHGIVCHLTSLVRIDEVAEAQDTLLAQRRVPLMSRPGADPFNAFQGAGSALFPGLPSGALSETASLPAHLSSRGGGLREHVVSGRLKPRKSLGNRAENSLRGLISILEMTLKEWVGRIEWSDAEALRQGDTTALPPQCAL